MNKELEKELNKKYSEVRKSLKPLSRNKIINLFLTQLEFALEQQALNIVLVERIKALEASEASEESETSEELNDQSS